MKRVLRLNTTLLPALRRVLGKTNAELIETTGVKTTTWYYLMGHPNGITVQQLISIANGLQIPVRRFFSIDETDVIGSQDDYVERPYQPCHYDSGALQQFINTHRVTWQDIANELGISRVNLRNSLLSVTRLPVTRFLTACEVFGIDPFCIIIDPNPQHINKRGRRDVMETKQEYAAIQHDINTIQHEMANFNAELTNVRRDIAALGKKIDALLGAHKKHSSPERAKRAAKVAKENQRLLDKKIVND